ncbi:16851_t:CDS:2 [Entrophospora sp. SA101]|nr:16851_t:CDS:2 [Entrophospora sp. SA101]
MVHGLTKDDDDDVLYEPRSKRPTLKKTDDTPLKNSFTDDDFKTPIGSEHDSNDSDESDDSNESDEECVLRLNVEEIGFDEYIDQGDKHFIFKTKDISSLFKSYWSKASALAQNSGLLVTKNYHEILSLSHILLVKSDDYSEMQVKTFSRETLEDLRKNIKSNFIGKEKSEKLATGDPSRAKQPDMIGNIVNNGTFAYEVMFGEVTGEGKNNTEKKNLIDLIRLGLFMKDSLDIILQKTDINRVFAWQVIVYLMVDTGDSVELPRSFETCCMFLNGLDTLRAFELAYEQTVKETLVVINKNEEGSKNNKFKTWHRSTLGTPVFKRIVKFK